MQVNNKVTCLILNYNDYLTTINLVNHIKDFDVIDKIIIVDNKSTDTSYEKLRGFMDHKITVIESDINGGYGYGNNFGVKFIDKRLNSKYTLICNPDVKFENSTIEKLLDTAIKENAVVSSCKQKSPMTENFNISAWDLPSPISYTLRSFLLFGRLFRKQRWKYTKSKDYISYPDCVAGSLLLVETKKFLQVGGYDENIFLYGEETLLGYKMKINNYKTILINETYYHYHSTTISKYLNLKKQKKQINKSRKYVIKNYLLKNKRLSFIFDILFWIVNLENAVIYKVYSIFGRRH